MHYGAGPSTFQNAQFLRANQTETEKLLWEKLRKGSLGVKFRRQHPIGAYVVDFYCHKFKLVVELDGDYHDSPKQKKLDALREEELQALELKVIRFTDREVVEKINLVLESIKVQLVDGESE